MVSRGASPPRKPVERRAARRTTALYGGVVADRNGKHLFDCTIQDVSERGAKVAFPTEVSIGDQVFLVDTQNHTAHLASVVRRDGGVAGLSFDRTYSLNQALPPERKFLGRIFIESKVGQLKSLVQRGLPVETAIGIIGLTKDHLDEHLEAEENDRSVLGHLRQVLALKHQLNA